MLLATSIFSRTQHVRSAHFPLGAALLYRNGIGNQWCLGRVLRTGDGDVTVGGGTGGRATGEQNQQKQEAFNISLSKSPELLRPLTHFYNGMSIISGSGLPCNSLLSPQKNTYILYVYLYSMYVICIFIIIHIVSYVVELQNLNILPIIE